MLWWRGLRSRPLVDVLLAVLSALAVAVAVLGPLLVRAIEQATVTDTVATAGPAGTSLTVYANGDVRDELGLLVDGTSSALVPIATGPSGRLWEPLQRWTESTDNVVWQLTKAPQGNREVYSRVRVAQDCRDLTLTSGRCPDAPGEALVSSGDARQHGVEAGDGLTYRLSGIHGARLLVVGTYDATRVGTPLTRPGTESAATAVVTADPLVVTAAQLESLPLPTQVSARLVLRQPVTLADEPLLRRAVADLGTSVLNEDVSLVIDTRLPDTLDRVAGQSRAAVVLVGVVEAQALGLALFAVVVVLARVARARSAEWGAGRLLGIPRSRWFRSVYVEPGVALLVGAGLGYGVAVLVGGLAVRAGLSSGTPFEPARWPVLAAAVAAGLLVLLALVVVSLPDLRRPLAELVAERSEAAGTTPLAAVAQAVAVLLAAFTVYVLLAGDVLGGRGPQVGLLAPALFALALAVVGVRLAVLLVRRRARRPARSLVGLVVARQAARTPSSLSPAVVVTVGMALVVFSGQVLALSVRNQELKATAVTGAATVLHLTAPPGADLLAAVDAADPGGREAMAVRERGASGATGTDRVVAVDAGRLAAVSAWSPGWAGLGDVAAALRPPTSAPVELRGERIDLRIDLVDLKPAAPLGGARPADPVLSVTVDEGTRWQTVRLGTIADRTRFDAAVPCTRGCRLVALGLTSTPSSPYTASLTVTGLGTDVDPPVPGGDDRLGGRWHARVGAYYAPDPDAAAEVEAGPHGLRVTFTDRQGGSTPSVAPSDVLDPLPVLLGPATQERAFAGRPGTAFGTGLDGDPQLVQVVGRAQVLPRALADGVLTDLRSARDLVDPQTDTSEAEVWLAPGAPPGVEAALVGAGFVVTGRDRLVDAQGALVREPTTRAAAVAQTLARTAALLTLLALVAARVADSARRRLDWRSLADAGVRRRTLRRLAAVEIAAPAVLGVLLGAASGLVAVVLVAPRLPLVDLTTPGPPLDLALDWSRALLAALVGVVVVLVVAGVGAVVETRRVAVS